MSTIIKFVFAIAIVGMCSVTLTGCSDPTTAARALSDQGYNDVKLTGRPGFLFFFSGCSDNDTFATGFNAKNVNGKPVSGVVCNGWFKGATIRTY